MPRTFESSQQFLTDKYKRFLNTNTFLSVFSEGLFLAGLTLFNIIPFGFALTLFARRFNNILLPGIRIFSSINNLIHRRKVFKSSVMLMTIALSMIIGGWLGYYFLCQSPFFMEMVTAFMAQFSAPPAITFAGGMLGGMMATLSNQCSPFLGSIIGLLIVSYFPYEIPLVVDIVFMSATLLTFMTSFIAKHSLRAYYYYHYGHTNADGLRINQSKEECENNITKQAIQFGVPYAQFKALIDLCKSKIKEIKHTSSWFDEYCGFRRVRSNSYKDIYHGLMNPALTTSDVDAIKDLLAHSQCSTVTHLRENMGKTAYAVLYLPASVTLAGMWLKPSFFSIKSDPQSEDYDTTAHQRMLIHQLAIEQGIDDDLISPFLNRTGA